MVERACLESKCTVLNRTEGSNPSLSARKQKAPQLRGFYFLTEWLTMRALANRRRAGFDKIVGNNFERRSEAKTAPKGRRAGCPE